MTTSKGETSTASRNITQRIEDLGDWRGEMLARVRRLMHEADPQVEEEWKWRGVPVWSHDGIICTGESYKEVVKLTFFRGAALPDPKKLFNSSLEGNARRAIDIREGEKLNEAALKALFRAAVDANSAARTKKPVSKAPAAKKSARQSRRREETVGEEVGDERVRRARTSRPAALTA